MSFVVSSAAGHASVALNAQPRPRQRLEPLDRDQLPTARAHPVSPGLEAIERLSDLREGMTCHGGQSDGHVEIRPGFGVVGEA